MYIYMYISVFMLSHFIFSLIASSILICFYFFTFVIFHIQFMMVGMMVGMTSIRCWLTNDVSLPILDVTISKRQPCECENLYTHIYTRSDYHGLCVVCCELYTHLYIYFMVNSKQNSVDGLH